MGLVPAPLKKKGEVRCQNRYHQLRQLRNSVMTVPAEVLKKENYVK